MTFTFQLIVLLGLSSGLWMGTDACSSDCCVSCPDGWYNLFSRCFFFDFNQMTWRDAEKYCITLGGNLASYNSEAERDELKRLVIQSAGRQTATWIGATDAVSDNDFRWSDGSPFTYIGWADKEPNNYGGNEDCAEFRVAAGFPVNDAPCGLKRSVLCAKDP